MIEKDFCIWVAERVKNNFCVRHVKTLKWISTAICIFRYKSVNIRNYISLKRSQNFKISAQTYTYLSSGTHWQYISQIDYIYNKAQHERHVNFELILIFDRRYACKSYGKCTFKFYHREWREKRILLKCFGHIHCRVCKLCFLSGWRTETFR